MNIKRLHLDALLKRSQWPGLFKFLEELEAQRSWFGPHQMVPLVHSHTSFLVVGPAKTDKGRLVQYIQCLWPQAKVMERHLNRPLEVGEQLEFSVVAGYDIIITTKGAYSKAHGHGVSLARIIKNRCLPQCDPAKVFIVQ